MLKWVTVIAILLTAALGWTIDKLIDAKADLKLARVRAEQLDGQLKATHERYERAALVRKEYDEFRIGLKRELDKTDWSIGRVPDSIIRMLCERADCTKPPYEVPAPEN